MLDKKTIVVQKPVQRPQDIPNSVNVASPTKKWKEQSVKTSTEELKKNLVSSCMF